METSIELTLPLRKGQRDRPGRPAARPAQQLPPAAGFRLPPSAIERPAGTADISQGHGPWKSTPINSRVPQGTPESEPKPTNLEAQAKRARTGWIQESVRTPKRNQQEVTEATEPRILSGFPLRLLRLLLFKFLRKNNRVKALILGSCSDILSRTEPSETVPVFVRLPNERKILRGSRGGIRDAWRGSFGFHLLSGHQSDSV